MPAYWIAERRDFPVVLEVTLDMEPHGKKRAQPVFNRAGRYAGKKKDPKTAAWEAAAVPVFERAWGGAPPLETPCSVVVQSFKARPKHYRKTGPEAGVLWCPVYPDTDNVAKAVFDALTRAGVWVDDALIVREQVETYYCAHGMAPCVRVQVGALVSFD